MKDKKQFWSLTAVVFLAVIMPTILRQVNKMTRVMAGAEGRLAAINIETDRILGKSVNPFVTSVEGLQISPLWNYQKPETLDTSKKWDYIAIDGQNIEPEEIRYLALKFGTANKLLMLPNRSNSYLTAVGAELLNTNMNGKVSGGKEVVEMFNRLGPQKMQFSGTGSWVYATATKKVNTYQVILANYDPAGSHSEVVPVNFLNLEQGKFEFRKTFWGSETTIEKVATDAGIIQKLIPMLPNSVVFLELEAK